MPTSICIVPSLVGGAWQWRLAAYVPTEGQAERLTL